MVPVPIWVLIILVILAILGLKNLPVVEWLL